MHSLFHSCSQFRIAHTDVERIPRALFNPNSKVGSRRSSRIT